MERALAGGGWRTGRCSKRDEEKKEEKEEGSIERGERRRGTRFKIEEELCCLVPPKVVASFPRGPIFF